MIPAGSAEIGPLIAEMAGRLLGDLDEIVREMDEIELAAVPALAADPAVAAEVSASNRANLQRWLVLAQRGAATAADPPPEALDIARTLVRRGVESAALFEAYRLGQQVAWRHWLECAAVVVGQGPELVEILRVSLTLISDYTDAVLHRVVEEAQREREAVLGGALARRTETAQLILDGAPIEPALASTRLGYDLDRQQTALVLWGAEAGPLETAATLLARAAGAGRPLTLPAGVTTLWAWLGTDREIPLEALRAAAVGPSVAVGTTRPGLAGFRRSHAEALDVQRLLLGPGGFASYRELEVTALAAGDRERAREFVAATLGPLAADDPSALRLRETLRVFLDEAENAPRAAARLHTHRNTVLQRVARASSLLGHPPGDDRLALALALELAHRLGEQMLR
ncbi:MAG TPA: helix-turn-helix domain-containing protein [Solirubrobacteraceae bacterium]|jgi:DNA-binding PucR family transcriptional regulator|nr:helix-turn-helix domain-containing protein [Solirubrobacteraceae bacterium]